MTSPLDQFLVADIAGVCLTAEERDRLRHPAMAGIVLFRRNFASREQLTDLIAEIRHCNPELLIMADQEGGRVQRFRGDGFTPLPAMGRFGRLYQQDPEQACRLLRECGWLVASELRATGIDLGLSPVLDLDRGMGRVIGDRSLSGDPEVVSILSTAFVEGLHEVGMPAVGKHFPGHGGVSADSHTALPVDRRSMGEIEEDMQPFARLISLGLDGVMPAHVRFPALDNDWPAGFSADWLQDTLRSRLGFGGVIFSDCLSMAGAQIAGTVVDRVRLAIGAGCDLALLCNSPNDVGRFLSNYDHDVSGDYGVSEQERKASRQRIGALHKRLTVPKPEWSVLLGSERRGVLIDALAAMG